MAKILDPSAVQLVLGLADSVTNLQAGVINLAVQQAEGAVIRHLKYDPVQRVRTEFYPRYSPVAASIAWWEATETTAYQRRVSQASTDELQLQHIPVRATDADGNNAIDLRIDYDGRNGTKSGSFATAKTEGEDFWPNYDGTDSNSIAFCMDGIVRSIGLWPDEPGSVKITYVGGYTCDELNGQDSILDASPIMDVVLAEAARRARKALAMANDSKLGMIAGPLMSEKLGDYSYRLDSSVVRALFGEKGDKSLLSESIEQLSSFLNYGALIV